MAHCQIGIFTSAPQHSPTCCYKSCPGRLQPIIVSTALHHPCCPFTAAFYFAAIPYRSCHHCSARCCLFPFASRPFLLPFTAANSSQLIVQAQTWLSNLVTLLSPYAFSLSAFPFFVLPVADQFNLPSYGTLLLHLQLYSVVALHCNSSALLPSTSCSAALHHSSAALHRSSSSALLCCPSPQLFCSTASTCSSSTSFICQLPS